MTTPETHPAHDYEETRIERMVEFFGTPRYLLLQSVVVLLWILVNTVAWVRHFDPYPFILLNLTFSTQAAYAAPLILFAQNRQARLDRAQAAHDYAINQEALEILRELQDRQ